MNKYCEKLWNYNDVLQTVKHLYFSVKFNKNCFKFYTPFYIVHLWTTSRKIALIFRHIVFFIFTHYQFSSWYLVAWTIVFIRQKYSSWRVDNLIHWKRSCANYRCTSSKWDLQLMILSWCSTPQRDDLQWETGQIWVRLFLKCFPQTEYCEIMDQWKNLFC